MRDSGLWCRHQKPRPSSRWTLHMGLSVWVGLLVLGEPGWPAERSGIGESREACNAVPESGGPIAELTFTAPQPFVIIAGPPQDWRRLYAAGETIAPPSVVGRGVRILQIDPRGVLLRAGGSTAAIWLEPGDRLPGLLDRFVEGTTLLGSLQYQFRVVAGSTDPEPRLICVLASHASLELTVPGPRQGSQVPAGGKEEATRMEIVAPREDSPDQSRGAGAAAPFVEVAPHTYRVGAKELQALLDQGARLVAEAWAGGWLPVPAPSRDPQAIESPVADGTLGPRGFRLMSAKWAEAAGLETGDLILAVDGRAVNTFDDLYHAYQQVRRVARRPRFEVTLERDGVQLTKTYLIQ